MTEFDVELPRPEWAGRDLQRYKCPLGGCRWFHDEPMPPRDMPFRIVMDIDRGISQEEEPSLELDATFMERWGITGEALGRAVTESAQRDLDTHRARAHAALVEHIRTAHYGPNVAEPPTNTAFLTDWEVTE